MCETRLDSNVAFVTAVPVSVSHASVKLESRPSLSTLSTRVPAQRSAKGHICMGYGSYSYVTDKTQGHTNQYYIDKYRRRSDLGRFSSPATDSAAVAGRTIKGTVKVPKEGIPEPRDPALPPIDTTAPEDPRIAEAEGSLYFWDGQFENPEFNSSTYADINDEEVSSESFTEFRSAMSEMRNSALSTLGARNKHRQQKFKKGLDQSYLLTLDGQHDFSHMMVEKMGNPCEVDRTETGYPEPVSALDFIMKEDDDSS